MAVDESGEFLLKQCRSGVFVEKKIGEEPKVEPHVVTNASLGYQSLERTEHVEPEMRIRRHILDHACHAKIRLVVEPENLAQRVRVSEIFFGHALCDHHSIRSIERSFRVAADKGESENVEYGIFRKSNVCFLVGFILILNGNSARAIYPCSRDDFRKVLDKSGSRGCQGNGSVQRGSDFNIHRSPANAVSFFMEPVIAQFTQDPHQNQHADCHSDGQTGDVDKRVTLVLFQASKSDFHVVFKHDDSPIK